MTGLAYIVGAVGVFVASYALTAGLVWLIKRVGR